MPKFPFSIAKKTSDSQSSILSFLIQFSTVAIIFFAIGFSVGKNNLQISRSGTVPTIHVQNTTPPADQNIDFSLLWKVLETLPKEYVDKSAIDGQKLLYGAISGMVRSLGDPYTAFLDPRQNEAVKSELSGIYEGIGIQIGFNKEKRLAVIAPLDGTPAQRAQIKPKDLIIKIDDEPTFDLTLPEAVDMIRGPAGTKVKLELQHESSDKPYEISIERAKITVKSVTLKFEERNDKRIAIIKVSRFGDTTDREWEDAISQIKNNNIDGIIVDMRNNPGGLLSSAVHLASEFTSGIIVKQEDSEGLVQSANADHKGEFLNKKLVVLINEGSASASEIFAGAIQDHNRGEIVGEKSFGKGSVQEPLDFPGGSGIHITVARWLTPKGHSIHAMGITPDTEIADDEATDSDEQLDRALAIITK